MKLLIIPQFLCLLFCLLGILVIFPYLITGTAYINNKYVSTLMINIDIKLSTDNCNKFNCGECQLLGWQPNRSKSKCLEEYLKKIPQSQNEHYFIYKSFYYPKILIILRSILDLFNACTKPCHILFNISFKWCSNFIELINKNIETTISVISVCVFFVFFCVCCCVPLFIFFVIAYKKNLSENQKTGIIMTNNNPEYNQYQSVKYPIINDTTTKKFEV